ncbi:hypothetical protein ABXT64_09790 [Candidatus Marifrigoribacter sp. Uisw_064]|uniref:hypothetical protein n=1 Tax=Candidatus Marifrigoribacter sp. Uisw_064 TaxID=3230970 RepID=UPI003D3D4FD8
MKMTYKTFLSALFIMSFFSINAQTFKSGSVTLNNNSVVNGKVSVTSEQQTIEVKHQYKKSNFTFSQVQKFTANDRSFEKKSFDEMNFFAHELVSGKASLYQIEKNKYLISKEDGVFKMIDSKKRSFVERGVLSVLFEDCNTIRESIYNVPSLSETVLIALINQYNACSYGEFSPTEKELSKANTFNTDEYKVFVGTGIGLRSISFFENNSTKNMSQFGFKVGVAATPSFLGNLQGDLYFNIEASANFGSEEGFSNSISPTSFSVNTYRLVFSSDYYFNKQGKIKPFIGVGIGISGDYFKGNVAGNEFDISGGSPVWMPKAGIMYTINNGKDISLIFDYIPEYDNDLSFPVGEKVIPLTVNSSFINIGLNYYF